MKLWLISQTENNDYDTYDSAVVAAETEEDARQMHPGSGEWGGKYPTWAYSPEKVTVLYIGDAVQGTVAHVILGSFNAG
jgi:hypothetical protein